MAVISTIIAGLYALGLWHWLKRVKKTITIKQTRLLLWTHAILLALTIFSLWLSFQYATSFRGMWTFRFIACLFLLTGIFIYPFGHKSQFNRITKVYFFLFSTLPTLVGVFLLVPFLGVVIVLSLYGRLSGTGDTLLYDDQSIRVQTTFLGVLGPPFLDIYKKDGVLEKRVYRSSSGWWNKVDSVKTTSESNLFTVRIYHDSSEDTTSPLVVTVRQ
jgi:hypothetical protein